MMRDQISNIKKNNSVIEENLKKVKADISNSVAQHNREVAEVKLIAVSKTFPVAKMLEAYSAGQLLFGESYPQELRDKLPEISSLNESVKGGFEPKLHFIGNLQRNKAKYVVGNVELIHSVGSVKLLKEVNKIATKLEITQDCLLQFNISGEESKGGMEDSDLHTILEEASQLGNVAIKGVMGISGLESDENGRREEFRRLVAISKRLMESHPSACELSMGMSGDYDIAIAEGSTMLRIGSAIFGARDYN